MPASHAIGGGGGGLARGIATAFSTAASTTGGGNHRGGNGFGMGVSGSGSGKLLFLTGIVLGAGVASLLHAFWSIGSYSGARRSGAGETYPLSLIASRDVVAVRGRVELCWV